MPPKLRIKVGVSAGGPPPHGGATLDRPTGGPPPNGGGASESAVNIDRRLKLTADAGASESIGGAICGGIPVGLSSVAPPLGGGTPADVSFVETNGATEQLSTYLASLSELEQRVCSIAKDHLESSFDLSRSSGYIAWKSKK